MNICVSLVIFMCIFLLSIIVTRRFTPLVTNIELQATLLIGYVSSSADLVDFSQYVNNEKITQAFNGVDIIYGLKIKNLILKKLSLI